MYSILSTFSKDPKNPEFYPVFNQFLNPHKKVKNHSCSNRKSVTKWGTTYVNILGNVAVSGTVDGVDVSAYGTKTDTAYDYRAPVGTIIMYGGSSAPSGWVLCNGQALSRTTYSSLFSIVGVTFGGGDGVNTFNVPDLRDRFIMGTPASESSGAGTDVTSHSRTLTLAQMPAHNHTASCSTDGSHVHGLSKLYVDTGGYAAGVGGPDQGTDSTSIYSSGSHNHTITIGQTGSGSSIDFRPKYFKLAFIMKL